MFYLDNRPFPGSKLCVGVCVGALLIISLRLIINLRGVKLKSSPCVKLAALVSELACDEMMLHYSPHAQPKIS